MLRVFSFHVVSLVLTVSREQTSSHTHVHIIYQLLIQLEIEYMCKTPDDPGRGPRVVRVAVKNTLRLSEGKEFYQAQARTQRMSS